VPGANAVKCAILSSDFLGVVSGNLVGLWLLIPEHLRLGTWDLLCGWTGQPTRRPEPRLALQLVHEAALCTTGVPEKRALSQNGFELANEPMELRLYSIDPGALAAGNSKWQFDGTLLRYRDRFGKSDGMNPVGGVVDERAGVHRIYVWAGDGANQAGIFEYRRTLDTGALKRYLCRVR
jgi:hypothetical protein